MALRDIIHIDKPEEDEVVEHSFLTDSAAFTALATLKGMAPDSGHDFMVVQVRAEDEALETERAAIETELMRQRGEIEHMIAELSDHAKEGSADAQIAELQGQLSALDANLAAIRYGGPEIVKAIAQNMSATQSAIHDRTTSIAKEGSLQTGVTFAEMVDSAYQSAAAALDVAWERWANNFNQTYNEISTLADELGVDMRPYNDRICEIEDRQKQLDMKNPDHREENALLNADKASVGVDAAEATLAEALANGTPEQVARAQAALKAAREAQEEAARLAEKEIEERRKLAERNLERAKDNEILARENVLLAEAKLATAEEQLAAALVNGSPEEIAKAEAAVEAAREAEEAAQEQERQAVVVAEQQEHISREVQESGEESQARVNAVTEAIDIARENYKVGIVEGRTVEGLAQEIPNATGRGETNDLTQENSLVTKMPSELPSDLTQNAALSRDDGTDEPQEIGQLNSPTTPNATGPNGTIRIV